MNYIGVDCHVSTLEFAVVNERGTITQVNGKEFRGKTRVKKVAKCCNRILKSYVVQSAGHISMYRPEDLQSDYKRRDAQGQHTDFGMSRRFLRMAISMMKTFHIYLPKSLRATKINMKDRANYYLKIWPKLIEKWHRAQVLDIAFDKNMPLGQWRNIVQELYGIELSL